jgi:hypothetical protein
VRGQDPHRALRTPQPVVSYRQCCCLAEARLAGRWRLNRESQGLDQEVGIAPSNVRLV